LQFYLLPKYIPIYSCIVLAAPTNPRMWLKRPFCCVCVLYMLYMFVVNVLCMCCVCFVVYVSEAYPVVICSLQVLANSDASLSVVQLKLKFWLFI